MVQKKYWSSECEKYLIVGGGNGLHGLVVNLQEELGIECTTLQVGTDRGGNSEQFRYEFDMIAPGDFRRALLALASPDINPVLRKLWNFRFPESDKSLGGYSIGNLLIAALILENGGDVTQALHDAGILLNIRGRVLATSTDNVDLELPGIVGDTSIFGEGNIDKLLHHERKASKLPVHVPEAYISPAAEEAILRAEWIIFPPGSFYGSTCTNLMVKGFREAVHKNKKLKIAYIPNLVTAFNEEGLATCMHDYLRIVNYYLGRKVDVVFVNTAPIPPAILKIYEEVDRSHAVPVDLKKLSAEVGKIEEGDFLEVTKGGKLRHSKEVARRLRPYLLPS